MTSNKINSTGTEEIPTRKISLTKLGSEDAEPKKGGVIGWEYAPPRIGRPYLIYLYEGMVLRTSAVQDVQKANKAFIVRTLNSVYQLEYLEEEKTE